MFDPLRIALAAEGPTDRVVIEAALNSMLEGRRNFVLTQIFPENSICFGELGTGWVGVYRWCHQSAARGQGRLQDDSLIFQNFDILILHLDADVAGHQYAQGSITPKDTDGILPCEFACPPASDTTNVLRSVLLSWCGEETPPKKTVICMPSKSTEAWVVAALFPNDQFVVKGIECYPNPEKRFSAQPKAKNQPKPGKDKRYYQMKAQDLTNAWPHIADPNVLGEAHRFQTEFLAQLSSE